MTTASLQHNIGAMFRWLTLASEGLDDELTEPFVKKMAVTVARRLIEKTPVDTGRARAGWTAYLDAQGVEVHVGGSDPIAIQEGRDSSSFNADFSGGSQFVEIINGVEYIIALEFGHSDQAPNGMVRVTIRELLAEDELGRAVLQELDEFIAGLDGDAGF